MILSRWLPTGGMSCRRTRSFGTLDQTAFPAIRWPVLIFIQLTGLLDAVWAPGFALFPYRSGASPIHLTPLAIASFPLAARLATSERRCTPVRSTLNSLLLSSSHRYIRSLMKYFIHRKVYIEILTNMQFLALLDMRTWLL